MTRDAIDLNVECPEEVEPESGSVITEIVEDEKQKGPDHPVDRGWAWVVLGACVFQAFVCVGIMRSFGVFFLQYQMRFNSNASETAIMSLIQNVLISVSGLFVMTVGLQKFSPRTAVFAGGILTWLSYFITAFIKDIRIFYFTQGALLGTGMSLMRPPILAILGTYFNKHRGLANSIYMGGASVGGLLFAPVVVKLFKEYKYEGAMLIISGLMLNICVAACLMRPISFYSRKSKAKSEELKHFIAEEKKYIKSSTPTFMSSNGDHVSLCSHSRLNSSDYSDGAYNGYLGNSRTKQSTCMRMESHDLSSYSVKQQGLPLLQRVGANSNDKLYIRHRTPSEDHCDRDDGMHVSKGKLKDVLEVVSRSQRNVCSSDEMFGSTVDIDQPRVVHLVENELPNAARHDENYETDESDTLPGCCNPVKQCFFSVMCTMFDMQLLRDPVFIVFLFMAFMYSTGVALAPMFLPQLAKEVGISNDNIAVILSLSLAIDLVSKITVAYITDRGLIKRPTILVIVAVVFGTACHLTVFIKSFPTMIVFAIAIGLCCGQYSPMYSVMLQDVTGPDKFAKSIGFANLVHGTSVAIVFPIAGLIRDVTKTYVATFHLFGGLAYTAGILVLVISVVNKRKLAREKKKQTNTSPS